MRDSLTSRVRMMLRSSSMMRSEKLQLQELPDIDANGVAIL
jgi:hypothetical protein